MRCFRDAQIGVPSNHDLLILLILLTADGNADEIAAEIANENTAARARVQEVMELAMRRGNDDDDHHQDDQDDEFDGAGRVVGCGVICSRVGDNTLSPSASDESAGMSLLKGLSCLE